ncbi:hypothetical protein [Massilia eurypsychrophila]|jgi:hypothetical protein|uniref:hypothetical protein n=1 Tax=Massilia eurypsychrophila TaxID=1485217 RepID=UPI0015D47E20|nr:hypothetical protein [Massilia eurypsychrophila]
MKHSIENIDSGIQELSVDEVNCVSGAALNVTDAGGAGALMAGIAAGAFGTGWGAIGVGAAFAAAPVAVVAMAGLSLYAGYALLRRK